MVTMVTDMRRRRKICLLLFSLVLLVAAAHYFRGPDIGNPEVDAVQTGTRKDVESRKDLRTSDRGLIIVFSAGDVCLKWRESFPGYRIVVVGNTEERKGPCIYTQKLEAVVPLSSSFQVAFVAVDDSQSAVSCIQSLLQHRSKRRRYHVLYSNPSEVFYHPTRHFGCGGVPLGQEVNPYRLCDNERESQIVVGIHGNDQSCDRVYPPMALDKGTYMLSGVQCAVLSKSVTWMLPFLTDFSREENVALSMMVNNLLWITGAGIEVMTPAKGQRSSFTDPMQATIGSMAAVLNKTACAALNFLECSKLMSKTLKEGTFVTDSEINQFNNWLTKLQAAGYQFPSVAHDLPNRKCTNNILQSFISTHDTSHHGYSRDDASERGNIHSVNLKQRQDLQLKTCSDSTQETHNFKEPWLHYDEVVLIVTYNSNKHYDTIPYFETLYRQFFPHVVYCGPGNPDWSHPGLKNVAFSFVSYAVTPPSLASTQGALHYECFVKITGMGYTVAGYIETSDDILMNPHRFRHYNVSRAWYWQLNNAVRVHTFNHNSCDDKGCKLDNRNGGFWQKFRKAVAGAINELNSHDTEAGKLCNENRAKLYGGTDWHIRIISDTYYVPARYAEDVAELLEIFIRNKVYLEIAIPTILHCVIPQSDFDPVYMFTHNLEKTIQGHYSYKDLKPANPDLVVLSLLDRKVIKRPTPREAIWHYVTPPLMRGAFIFHPHKLGHVATGNDREVQFFCDVLKFFGDETGDAEKYLTE